jgi:hypothetical protein
MLPLIEILPFSIYPITFLKIEAAGSSETSVDFELTTRHYIPEGRTHVTRWL